MNLFQLFLLILFGSSFLFYFVFFRSRLRDRIVVVLGLGLISFFIIFPNYLSLFSQTIGVGRGVDLIFYLALILGAFVTMLMYTKIQHLEKNLTELARKMAVEENK